VNELGLPIVFLAVTRCCRCVRLFAIAHTGSQCGSKRCFCHISPDYSECQVLLLHEKGKKRLSVSRPEASQKQSDLLLVFRAKGAGNSAQQPEQIESWKAVQIIPLENHAEPAFLVFSREAQKSEKSDIRSQLDEDYRFIFDHAHEAIITRSLRTSKLSFCNQNALELYGASSAAEIGALRLQDTIANETNEGMNPEKFVQEIVRRLVEKGQYQREFWFKKISGELIWVSAVWVCDKRDDKDWKVVSFLRDITLQQSSQLGLIQKNQELETSRTSMEFILENSHEAIVLQEFDSGKVIACNKKALELYGAESESVLTDFRVYEREMDTASEFRGEERFPPSVYEDLLKTGRAEVNLWFRKSDGKLLRLEVIAVADFRDANKRRIITFEKDVTESYQAKLALHEKNEELEKYIAANFYLQKFAFMASHDLQAPLSTMISFSNLLENSLQGRISDREKKYLDIIASSGKNLRLFIDDLLSFSRFETQKTVVDDIDLKKLLSILLLELDSSIDEKNATILYEHLDLTIKASPIKLRQIFQNLISNALKFSKEDENPEIYIDCVYNEKYWNFVVKDNGIGIPEAEAEHIFDLFARLNSSGFPGNGIGLAMVKKLVEQHNGKVWCRSMEGEGSSFFFSIARDLEAMVDEA